MQSIAVLEKRLEPVNGGADAASIKHSVEACSLPFCRRASAGVRLIREHQATGKCSLGHGSHRRRLAQSVGLVDSTWAAAAGTAHGQPY